MLETEQQSFTKVELPAKEDVERVAYCVGAYLSAFSKEPFDEKWSINGERSSAFLLNPKTTGEFVKDVLEQEDVVIFSLSDGSEQAKVQKEIVLNHIEKTLNNPMTEYLFSSGWISEDEVVELEDLRNKIEQKDEPFVDVNTPYPLTNVLESYISATEDPVSMVLLGYQESDILGQNAEVKFMRIKKGIEAPKDIYPRVVCRYTTVNSPKSRFKQNAQDFVINEVGYYLKNEEIEQVQDEINPSLSLTFFGELAKIPSSDKSLKAIPVVGAEYINIITENSEDGKNYDFLDLIPSQAVYLSVEGTSVLLEGQRDGGTTKLFDGIMGLLDALNLKYTEKTLRFKNDKNKEVVIGIIKRVEDDSL